MDVCAFGRWGTVCDDQFDSSDAIVVCRQLGLSKYELSSSLCPYHFTNISVHSKATKINVSTGGGVVLRSGYSDGTGNIWLDDLDCDGSEDNIFDCSAAPLGGSNCGHHEDVGVMCQP